MSWWKRLFGLQSSNERPAAESSPSHLPAVNAADDSEDSLLVEARNLVALTGPKAPYELSRLLKIGYARAAALSAATNPQLSGGTRVCIPQAGNQQLAAAQPNRPVEPETLKPKRQRAKKAPPPKAKLPPITGKISGTNECGFNIVGESHYQPALRRLRNGRSMATDNDFVADIVTEPDNPHDENACAVYIEGLKVGYLPRKAATNFVRQIGEMGVYGVCRFQTKAKLAGGWGDRPMVGVLLSLPKA